MEKKRNKKRPELKVLFDTSALYNKSASDLLNHQVSTVIREHSNHADLQVTWFLPEIVIHERQYQMENDCLALLPSIKKLERLLGHNLNITEDILKARIRETIDRQVAELNICILPFDASQVEWNRLILDAAYRRPPFERGEKEKGFRDALVVEAFLQLASRSPTTPGICRLALVAGDTLLSDTVRARTVGRGNIRILADCEALHGLINTLVSDITEEFAAKIQEVARGYFYNRDNPESLFLREKISQTINDRFGVELKSVPPGAARRSNGTWVIQQPQFVRKESRRVFWVSQISVEAQAYRMAAPGITIGEVNSDDWMSRFLVALKPLFDRADTAPQPVDTPTSALRRMGTPISAPKEIRVAAGSTIFDITWSVVVTSGKTPKLTHPRIESIELVETSWD